MFMVPVFFYAKTRIYLTRVQKAYICTYEDVTRANRCLYSSYLESSGGGRGKGGNYKLQ